MSFQFQLQQLQNGRAKSYNELRIAIQETSIMILGHDTDENQLNYLKFTKKPKELTIDEWFRRILNINLSLPYISADGEQPLRARTLLKEVVMKNIPPALQIQFRIQGGETLGWNQAKIILSNLFLQLDYNNFSRQRNERGSKRGNNNNNRRNVRDYGRYNEYSSRNYETRQPRQPRQRPKERQQQPSTGELQQRSRQ